MSDACITLPLPTHAQLAFKYLGVVLFPLFLCYAVYSLLYNEHKGWYSFILNMAYGFLLTFGEPLSQKLNIKITRLCVFDLLASVASDSVRSNSFTHSECITFLLFLILGAC